MLLKSDVIWSISDHQLSMLLQFSGEETEKRKFRDLTARQVLNGQHTAAATILKTTFEVNMSSQV